MSAAIIPDLVEERKISAEEQAQPSSVSYPHAEAQQVRGFYSDQDILILRDALLNKEKLKMECHSILKNGYRTYCVSPFIGTNGLDGLKEIICIALLDKEKNKQILVPYRMETSAHWVTMRLLVRDQSTIELEIHDSADYYKKENIETKIGNFFHKKKEFYEFLSSDKRVKEVIASGCDLCLMSELPKDVQPNPGKIYLEKNQQDKLQYIVLSPQNQVVKGELDISVERELTKDFLNKKKSEILEVTSNRGHTLASKDRLKEIFFGSQEDGKIKFKNNGRSAIVQIQSGSDVYCGGYTTRLIVNLTLNPDIVIIKADKSVWGCGNKSELALRQGDAELVTIYNPGKISLFGSAAIGEEYLNTQDHKEKNEAQRSKTESTKKQIISVLTNLDKKILTELHQSIPEYEELPDLDKSDVQRKKMINSLKEAHKNMQKKVGNNNPLVYFFKGEPKGITENSQINSDILFEDLYKDFREALETIQTDKSNKCDNADELTAEEEPKKKESGEKEGLVQGIDFNKLAELCAAVFCEKVNKLSKVQEELVASFPSNVFSLLIKAEFCRRKKELGESLSILEKIKRCDLCLMSELLQDERPGPDKLYLEKQGDKLKYIALSQQGSLIEAELDIRVEGDLTKEFLNKKKLEILAITSKRGHTQIKEESPFIFYIRALICFDKKEVDKAVLNFITAINEKDCQGWLKVQIEIKIRSSFNEYFNFFSGLLKQRLAGNKSQEVDGQITQFITDFCKLLNINESKKITELLNTHLEKISNAKKSLFESLKEFPLIKGWFATPSKKPTDESNIPLFIDELINILKKEEVEIQHFFTMVLISFLGPSQKNIFNFKEALEKDIKKDCFNAIEKYIGCYSVKDVQLNTIINNNIARIESWIFGKAFKPTFQPDDKIILREIALFYEKGKNGIFSGDLEKYFKYCKLSAQAGCVDSAIALSSKLQDIDFNKNPDQLTDLIDVIIYHQKMLDGSSEEQVFSKIKDSLSKLEKKILTITNEEQLYKIINEIAQIYSQGKKVKKDYKKAQGWYIKSVRNGDDDARICLGKLFLSKAEYKKAFFWYYSALKKGHKNAKEEIEQLKTQAVAKLKTEQESKDFFYCIASLYESSGKEILFSKPKKNFIKVEQNCQEAIEWYLLALDKGLVESQSKIDAILDKIENDEDLVAIGKIYINRKELQTAVKLFIRAAKRKNEEACRALDEMVANEKYLIVQKTLGDFYKEYQNFKDAMRCYESLMSVSSVSDNLSLPNSFYENKVKLPSEITIEVDYGSDEEVDENAREYNQAQEFVSSIEEVYLPEKQNYPVSMFHQSNIPFTLTLNNKKSLPGFYSGTIGGFDLTTNGLGVFHFSEKSHDVHRSVFYKGDWQNGQWNGNGCYKEQVILNNKKNQVSIDISNAYFLKGKLSTKIGHNDSHICVIKTIGFENKQIEIHYYGQMKQFENESTFLPFLRDTIASRNFCFDSSGQQEFPRVGQIKIMTNLERESYEVVGYWNIKNKKQELEKLLRNDLLNKKLEIINNIRMEIRKGILKTSESSRYEIAGFYFQVVKKSNNLANFIKCLLKNEDQEIVPEKIRNFAKKLQDVCDLVESVKEFFSIESHDEMVEEITKEVEGYITGAYLSWIQDFDDYDKEYIESMEPSQLLLINPHILKMFFGIRNAISEKYSISPYFPLKLTKESKELIEIFIQCYGSYFNQRPEKEFFELIGYDDSLKKYRGGKEGFHEKLKKIKQSCENFEKCFNCLLEILNKQDNQLTNEKMQHFLRSLYESYSKTVLSYKFHLESNGETVDYVERHNQVIKEEVGKFKKAFIEELPNKNLSEKINKFLAVESIIDSGGYFIKINYILNIIEYLFKIERMSDDLDNQELVDVVNIQLDTLSNFIELPTDIMRRAINVFSSFLENFKNFIESDHSQNFPETLSSIKISIKQNFCFILNKAKSGLSQETVVAVSDFVEKQNSFLLSIKDLPLFIDKKNKESKEFFEILESCIQERGAQGQGTVKIKAEKIKEVIKIDEFRKHFSYEILQGSLNILNEILEKNKRCSLKENLIILDRYYDSLGELVKQFEKQIDQNDLEKYKSEKLKYFDRCKNINSLERLNEYLEVLKKLISIKGNQKEINSDKAIDEFLQLNLGLKENRENFRLAHELYQKKILVFKTEFYKKSITIKNIVEQMNKIVLGSRENIVGLKTEHQVHYQQNVFQDLLTVLAGLSFILTVRVSKISDPQGRYLADFEGIELSPHVIQILGCIKFLQLYKDVNKETIKEWLSVIPKQIGEVLTGQGKSWQISLLATLYALFGYKVVVACYSEYLSGRDSEDFRSYFQDIPEVLDKVYFKTLERLACDEIEENCKSNEKLASLVEQIVFKQKYDSSGGCTPRYSLSSSSEENSDYVVIVDEVDTLISTELNNSISRISVIKSEELAEAMNNLYQAAKKESVLENSQVMRDFENTVKTDPGIKIFSENQKSLFESYKKEVLECANEVADYYSHDPDRQKKGKASLRYYLDASDCIKFRLRSDGNFWEYFDGSAWVNTTYCYYYNAFFYLELFSRSEQHKGKKINHNAYGYLKLSCGRIYYSSVVSKMTEKLMIGVTGSMMKRDTGELLLSEPEKNLVGSAFLGVNDYNITYFPSFFGLSRVLFNPNDVNYFLVVEKEAEWFHMVVERCLNLSSKGIAILVFLREQKQMQEIFSRLVLRGKEPHILTDDLISANQDGVRKNNESNIEKMSYTKQELEKTNWQKSVNRLISENCAGQGGQITLITASYGRGTDFKASEAANKNGGIHVIQSWFSEDPKEEIQVRGRTGRNAAPGVYMQILCLEHFKKDFPEAAASSTYENLKEMAKKKMSDKYSNVHKKIESQKTKSDALLTWLKDAREDRQKKIRQNDKSPDPQLIQNYLKI